MNWVAVVTIRGAMLLYAGTSVTVAAAALLPGTCFGRGDSETEAIADAEQRAAKFAANR